ncbi:MAG: hypothetical protein IT581_22175 [Verrucomicrobiales bacterium]|nr:hypothetical protein [Verrucomicrobiales bacterium]
MDQVIAVLLAALFGVWALSTVLVHFDRFSPLIRAVDFFTVVPEWRFFAPNPGRGDFFLLYRDQLDDASVTDWREVRIIRPRAVWSAVWNPRRREAKALFDAAIDLARTARDEPDSVMGSIPYLTLLSYVSAQPHWTQAVRTQFLLMLQDNDEPNRDIRPVHLSDLHAL